MLYKTISRGLFFFSFNSWLAIWWWLAEYKIFRWLYHKNSKLTQFYKLHLLNWSIVFLSSKYLLSPTLKVWTFTIIRLIIRSFEKFDAICLLKGVSEQSRIQIHFKNINSVFHIILLDVFFKRFKISEETTSEVINIISQILSLGNERRRKQSIKNVFYMHSTELMRWGK